MRKKRFEKTQVYDLLEGTREELEIYLRRLISGNSALIQDILQETYLKAMENPKRLTEVDHLMPWLKACARNLYLDLIKSPKNKGHIELSLVEDLDTLATPADETPLSVKATLARCDSSAQEILILIDMQGYSYAEAAKYLGITEDAVRSRLHRARQTFQESYSDAA